jgi:tRNA 2-thiocytidine biosynthesis protein TtcA
MTLVPVRNRDEEGKLFRRLRHSVGRAVADFHLIAPGDRIAVALSGGKDSYILFHLLESLRRRAPISYELVPVTVDPGFEDFRTDLIASHLEPYGYQLIVERTDHVQLMAEKRRPGSSYCSICARFKRGILYTTSRRLGCNKLALGHHLDDFIETLLLNQFFVGSLKAMAPRMLADCGDITVIRPLVYLEEREILEEATARRLPIVSCSCPAVDGIDLQRQRMKRLLSSLEQEIPSIKRSLLHALANVHPRHLLDTSLQRRGEEEPLP